MLVPDLISPVVGYRTWVMTPDGIISPMMYDRKVWPVDRAMVANCHLREAFGRDNVEPHDSPDKDCSCGLHSFSSLPKNWMKWASNEERVERQLIEKDLVDEGAIGSFVPGLVDNWGKIFEGDNGRRAEYAYPKAFGFSPLWSTQKQKRVNQMALMYGVESVPIYELQEYADSQ